MIGIAIAIAVKTLIATMIETPIATDHCYEILGERKKIFAMKNRNLSLDLIKHF